jgi:hypothetical protein
MASQVGPARNWGAVLILVMSSVVIVLAAVYQLWQHSVAGAVASIVQFLFEYFPGSLAVFSGVVVLAFGTKKETMPHVRGLAGPGRLGEATVFGWGLLSLATQLTFLGLISNDQITIAGAMQVEAVCGIAAVLVGVLAGVFIVRARVARGFARYAMFVTVALSAVTLGLDFADTSDVSALSDLPRMAGLVILGAACWRAGTPRGTKPASGDANPGSVTRGPKSLAE